MLHVRGFCQQTHARHRDAQRRRRSPFSLLAVSIATGSGPLRPEDLETDARIRSSEGRESSF